jgi:hypothetical protein
VAWAGLTNINKVNFFKEEKMGMNGTRTLYDRPAKKRYAFQKTGPCPTAKAAKANRQFCPLSNVVVVSADPERRVFLVHGKQVPFKLSAFQEHCSRVGWQMPHVPARSPFDIEAWLIEQTKNVNNDPPKSKNDRSWQNITAFAVQIGLKTNFFQAITRS